LEAWAKNDAAATGEAEKMIVEDGKEHRGYDAIYVVTNIIIIIARREENVHGKLFQ
jgi:hypothetical protein